MLNYYYGDTFREFLEKSDAQIIGEITQSDFFDTRRDQNRAWNHQIKILKEALIGLDGNIFFEFSIPRMGKRVDVLLIIKDIVFVVEFKVGQTVYIASDIDQVWDYALDLKNFHAPSHSVRIIPILISTEAEECFHEFTTTSHNDNLLSPVLTNKDNFGHVVRKGIDYLSNSESINGDRYSTGSYSPTPTIIEAALSLYKSHSVAEITRNDASEKNLSKTSKLITELIDQAKRENHKKICFVTGVPGAGKTLVGLNIATQRLGQQNNDLGVYLSGNGPLVEILKEALALDKVKTELELGNRITKKSARSAVSSFIQNIHHYRDAYLIDENPPADHVAIFDEAQRAWTKKKASDFMKRRKGIADFNQSEPEFLISCLDRHDDWAVIVCLVGGGQEINTGEAGISEWLKAIKDRFSNWEVHISPDLEGSVYNAFDSINELKENLSVHHHNELHLSVSMRSFRAETVSKLVKEVLELDRESACQSLNNLSNKYPIVLTRDLDKAKNWLREKARGTERYGMVVSAQAQRLKPYAIDVKTPMNPVHWFLKDKEDVRSSFYLEQVATEFHVQGLELDWACVVWDGDLRFTESGWDTNMFKGSKWQKIRKPENKKYLINAYRVLLTRARQGMVIVVPYGEGQDHTRLPAFYDKTYEYLKSIGIKTI